MPDVNADVLVAYKAPFDVNVVSPVPPFAVFNVPDKTTSPVAEDDGVNPVLDENDFTIAFHELSPAKNVLEFAVPVPKESVGILVPKEVTFPALIFDEYLKSP